jgi:hypothetical protein
MSWDMKGTGKHQYYYRSERQPGRPYPVKVYIGKGPDAEKAARQLEERQQALQARRQADREAILAEHLGVSAAEESLRELRSLVEALVRDALCAAGYHQHRGEWRRQRHGKDSRGA